MRVVNRTCGPCQRADIDSYGAETPPDVGWERRRAAGTDVGARHTESDGGALNRKLTLALPLVLALLALSAGTASAVPGTCDPAVDPGCSSGGGGTTTTHPVVHLTVAAPSRGTVTASDGTIACGGG